MCPLFSNRASGVEWGSTLTFWPNLFLRLAFQGSLGPLVKCYTTIMTKKNVLGIESVEK